MIPFLNLAFSILFFSLCLYVSFPFVVNLKTPQIWKLFNNHVRMGLVEAMTVEVMST